MSTPIDGNWESHFDWPKAVARANYVARTLRSTLQGSRAGIESADYAEQMRLYKGSRVRAPERQVAKVPLESGPRVVAVEAFVARPLSPASSPSDYPFTLEDDFEWGYAGSGPLNLAGAILNDALGFVPAAVVVVEFCDSVIAELPQLEFELAPEVLQAWLDVRLTRGSQNALEVAVLQHI